MCTFYRIFSCVWCCRHTVTFPKRDMKRSLKSLEIKFHQSSVHLWRHWLPKYLLNQPTSPLFTIYIPRVNFGVTVERPFHVRSRSIWATYLPTYSQNLWYKTFSKFRSHNKNFELSKQLPETRFEENLAQFPNKMIMSILWMSFQYDTVNSSLLFRELPLVHSQWDQIGLLLKELGKKFFHV